jgi:hypothetical protein
MTNDKVLTLKDLNRTNKKFLEKLIVAFCQVLHQEEKFGELSVNLTSGDSCLSWPNIKQVMMTLQPTATPKTKDKSLTLKDCNRINQRRLEKRILAFCGVRPQEGNLVGLSFNLSSAGICLGLPNTWTTDNPFSVILKRADCPSLPDVTISVESLWRKSYNENFDKIGGQILQVDSQPNFQAFLKYCQEVGPGGLLDKN